MSTTIELHRLSKRYFLEAGASGYHTLRDALAALVRHGGGRDRAEVWALRDVELSVDEGEVLGVIGRNGAGKSTLLKILAGITEPTSGVARMRGRVGALLEVGTGFHPELTGRENVYLNGALIGMSRRDIQRKFDAIVEFAGVQDFLDTPIKWYSTGMGLRLAFSVAAHLEPEIVVVDEVLAVGDVEFQRKCLGKMSEFEREGRTVLFVSHDLSAIGTLCSRALWLEAGSIRVDGPAADVIDRYLSSGLRQTSRVTFDADPALPASLRSVAIADGRGQPITSLPRDEALLVSLEFTVAERVPGLDAAVCIDSAVGGRILDEAWRDSRSLDESIDDPGRYELQLEIPPLLAPGEYTIRVWLGYGQKVFFYDDALSFHVRPRAGDPVDERRRVIQPAVAWRMSRSSQ